MLMRLAVPSRPRLPPRCSRPGQLPKQCTPPPAPQTAPQAPCVGTPARHPSPTQGQQPQPPHIPWALPGYCACCRVPCIFVNRTHLGSVLHGVHLRDGVAVLRVLHRYMAQGSSGKAHTGRAPSGGLVPACGLWGQNTRAQGSSGGTPPECWQTLAAVTFHACDLPLCSFGTTLGRTRHTSGTCEGAHASQCGHVELDTDMQHAVL